MRIPRLPLISVSSDNFRDDNMAQKSESPTSSGNSSPESSVHRGEQLRSCLKRASVNTEGSSKKPLLLRLIYRKALLHTLKTQRKGLPQNCHAQTVKNGLLNNL